MAACVMCGSLIPDGQRTCSMCYGDIEHGNDNYCECSPTLRKGLLNRS